MISSGLRYEKSKVAASLHGSFMILGAESSEQTYAAPYAKGWLPMLTGRPLYFLPQNKILSIQQNPVNHV